MPLSSANQSAVLAGVASSDSVFYILGGAILVILSGMWGFNRVLGLLGGRSGSAVTSDGQSFDYDAEFTDVTGDNASATDAEYRNLSTPEIGYNRSKATSVTKWGSDAMPGGENGW